MTMTRNTSGGLLPRRWCSTAARSLRAWSDLGGVRYLKHYTYLLYFDACHHEGQHRWVRFLPARYPGTEAERVDWDDDYQRLYVVRTPSSLSQLIITLHL